MKALNIAFLLCIFLPGRLLASNTDHPVWPVLVLTGGTAFVSGLDSSSDFPIGLSQYDYEGQTDNLTRPIFGGWGGAEFFAGNDWKIQTGLAYYQISTLPISGTLTQGFDAQSSDQLHYRYTIENKQVLVETKLLLNSIKRFHPYASLGLGVAFNDAQDYKTEADDCLFTPFYENASETHFSYTLGLGIDYDLNKRVRFGLGYHFADLGKAQLGDGELAGTAIPEQLDAVHLYAQEIVAQFTFLLI